MATLSFIGEDDHRMTVISKPSFTIGRHGDFQTPEMSLSVSRLHCALFATGHHHTIRDLNSFSGTRVNGEGIGNKERRLESGDKISLGNHVIVVYRKGGIH